MEIARYCTLENRNKFYLYDWNRIEIYEIGLDMYTLLSHTENMGKHELIEKISESKVKFKEDIIELINEGRLFYDSQEKFADNMGYPSSISIMCSVGYACNLDCIYCLLKERNSDVEAVDDINVVPNILRVVGKIYKDYNEIKIVIADGGEPFLFRDKIMELFNEIDKIDTERKIKITVTTNGTIYDQEILNILSEHDANIVFSLEGHIENNDIRKSKGEIDNYSICVDNYAKFQNELRSSITKNFWAVSIVNAESKSIVSTLIDLYDIGFRTIQFRLVKGRKNDVGINEHNLDYFIKLYDELFDFFIKNIDDDDDKYIKTILNNGDFVGQLFVPLLLGETKVKHCLGAFSTISIDKDGKIYPCAFLNGESSEEIKSFDCEDQIIMKYRKLDIDNIEQCSQCWASTACGGHCLYQSIKCKNAFDEPDESVCSLIKHILANIVYIIDYVEENNFMIYQKLYNFVKKRTYLYDLLL